MRDTTDAEIEAMLAELDGHSPATTPLAAELSALRAEAELSPTAPSPQLAEVLAEGLAPVAHGIPTTAVDRGILTASADSGILTRGILTASTDRGILTASADAGILTRGILTMQRHGRTLRRLFVTQFAALGLLGKAVAAGAAVSVAAAGAGTAGALPDQAQVAFDQVTSRIADDVDDETTGTDDTELVTDDEGADDFGRRVSEDATGESDGVPGVDGREISDEASDGRSTEGRARAPEAPGKSSEAPGQADKASGESGDASDESDDASDESDDASDESDDASDESDDASDASDDASDESDEAPGKSRGQDSKQSAKAGGRP